MFLHQNQIKRIDGNTFRSFINYSIWFIDLRFNNFNSDLISYYNSNVIISWNSEYKFNIPNSEVSISEFATFLCKNGRFTSDLNLFLSQFTYSTPQTHLQTTHQQMLHEPRLK